jgi:hypothetical protein
MNSALVTSDGILGATVSGVLTGVSVVELELLALAFTKAAGRTNLGFATGAAESVEFFEFDIVITK